MIRLPMPMDHPAYAGHFPGHPILPGAVLLDATLQELQRCRGLHLGEWRLLSAKFLMTVVPGDELTLELVETDASMIRFVIRKAAGAVASGTLSHGA